MPGLRRAALAAVLSSTLGVGMIFGFQPPLIALLLGRSGSSNFTVGAVTAATLIAVILLGPWYPALIARAGLKRCLLAGVAVAAVLQLIMPLLPRAEWWLVLRFATGCALGLSWISSEVWLNNLGGTAARGSVMGLYGTVFSAGVMAGPAALELTGTQGSRPFAVGAACLLATLLPLALARRVHGTPQAFTPLRGAPAILRSAPVVMWAAVTSGLVESAELTLLPLFGIHAGLSDGRALRMVTVFMAGNVVLQIPIGMLADRVGRRTMLGCCAFASGVGPLLLLPALAQPWLLWPLLFFWGGTLYAFYSQGIALLGDVFPESVLATANTVFVMVYCLGGVLGPSVGGLVMDRWPGHGLQVYLSATALTLLVGLAAGTRRLRPAPS